MIFKITAKDIDEQSELIFDEAINGEVEYLQRQDNDDVWWVSK